MARIDTRIENAIAEYRKRYGEDHSNAAAFYITDYHDILRLSRKENNGSLDPYTPIFNALEAGFVIGYRKAQRDARKRAKGEK